MSFDFSKVSLKQISSKIGDGIHGTPIYDENGSYYFINGNNLGSGRIVITPSTKKISRDEYLKHKKELNASTVLLSINGTIGNVALYDDEPIILGKSACYINILPGVNAYYISYVLKDRCFQHYIKQQANGSTIKNVSLKLVRDYEFTLPPKFVQDRIAEILLSLDEKITANENISMTLEQMAQALFKSWFVDFEPVKAKIAVLEAGGSQEGATLAAMTAISGKDADALAVFEREHPEQYAELKATAELFPSAMQESELGEIPEGWNVIPLENATSLIIDHRGKTPKKLGGDWSESGYPAISAKNIKDGRLVRHDAIKYVDPELYLKWMKDVLLSGDILMTSEAPLGELLYLAKDSDYLLSQRLYGIRADNNILSGCYLYLWLQGASAKADISSRATGSTVVGIRQSELKKVNVMVPGKALIASFSRLAAYYLAKIESNEKQNIALENLRDTLLPKLLSSEIILPEAEQAVSEAENV